MNKSFVLFALIWVGKLAAAQTSGCQDQIQHFPGFDYISHPISKRYLVLERFCREYQNGECIFFDYQYVCREGCLLYTSPSPRDRQKSRMPSSA